ncbi:MAG: RdgB/HAM1 family non-canonical purine NTP pyrophosphatase [Proteobacteria bacterium]|nr:RdgB/HAM1 family non-canonical purine NTP pyrophosphatase [Pseudomonadota bacterium]
MTSRPAKDSGGPNQSEASNWSDHPIPTRVDVESSIPRLVFATRNRGKVAELRQLLRDLRIEVFSLHDLEALGANVSDVVEDGDTFLANATKKARQVSRETGLPALADDSGLEVDALGGGPGVHSARYAGTGASDADNNTRLLHALRDVPDNRRSARFRSSLVLADPTGPMGDELMTAEGVCECRILDRPRGSGGFGYDPLFYVPELGATFAELGIGTKNHRSHRARAMAALKPRLVGYFHLAKTARSG